MAVGLMYLRLLAEQVIGFEYEGSLLGGEVDIHIKCANTKMT